MIHQREIILIVGLEKNFIRIFTIQIIPSVFAEQEISQHDSMKHWHWVVFLFL
mgnify:CR=1 FL=1